MLREKCITSVTTGFKPKGWQLEGMLHKTYNDMKRIAVLLLEQIPHVHHLDPLELLNRTKSSKLWRLMIYFQERIFLQENEQQ